MILYGHYYSPYARRVGVALLHRDIPFHHEPVSTRADAEKIRAINPLVRIPILLTSEDIYLIESTMILDYIDTKDGKNNLAPPPGPDRWRMLYRLALILGTVEKLAACLYEISRRPPEKVHQPWLDHCLEQARAGLDAIDTLPETEDEPVIRSHADIMLAIMWDFLINQFDVDPRSWPSTRRSAQPLLALPVFKATQPTWPTKPPSSPMIRFSREDRFHETVNGQSDPAAGDIR